MATTARFEPSHPPRVPGWVPGWQALYGERLRNVVHGVAEPAFDVLHKQRRVLNLRIHLVNSPDMIGHVLLDNQANYPRPPIARKVLRPFIGEGLLTAEGAAWKLQRRIVAGAFTPAAVGRLAGLMNDAARAQVQRWPARAVRMDLAPEATRLTMRVIAATLFAGDARLTAPEAGAHIARIIAASGQPRPLALLGVGHLDPSPSQIAVRHSARWLRQRIGVLVDDQGQDMAAGFFAELVRALRADYPRAEADALALDNALTFFVAGHENTATALAWGAYLFAAQPALQEQLRAEAVAALTGSSAALSRCCASFWTKPCGFTHRWRRSRGRRWPMMTCAVCTYARAICWRSTRGWSTAIAGCGTIRTPLTSPAFRQKTAPRRTVSNTCRSERGRASAWGCALPRSRRW